MFHWQLACQCDRAENTVSRKRPPMQGLAFAGIAALRRYLPTGNSIVSDFSLRRTSSFSISPALRS
jgi:hypothetical protein